MAFKYWGSTLVVLHCSCYLLKCLLNFGLPQSWSHDQNCSLVSFTHAIALAQAHTQANYFTCVIYRTGTTYVLYVNRAGEKILCFAFILLVILWINIRYINVLNKERKNTSHVMSLVWIILFKLLLKKEMFPVFTSFIYFFVKEL